MDVARRTAQAIAQRAVRRALPPGIAAVSVGPGDARVFIARPELALPELRAATLRCLDEPGSAPRLLIVVRADELRATSRVTRSG